MALTSDTSSPLFFGVLLLPPHISPISTLLSMYYIIPPQRRNENNLFWDPHSASSASLKSSKSLRVL
ncbi:hypothetical protein M404DRAFT_723748 [Pisolithus tinctorius Marx 270]|uniref:Uncharacterized protein n=1 Tax=Pisolithus tinctorius Marx 270 TaxID=870435 RepID=A0A0C3NL84_PISTI|nr:hypothetical protein M404DRAFT_723748 [Pisolithus tinctorius Marx 270]